jgi:hypothetical protein
MSDSDEAADGHALAFEEAALLHAKMPSHPLLKYVLHHDNDEIWEEFVERFGKPGITREAKKAAPAVAYMYAMYWVALREANADPEKEVVVVHSSGRPSSSLNQLTSDRYSKHTGFGGSEDDLPF